MILVTFMEVSGLKKAVDAAYFLDITVQSIYNYRKDPSSMKMKTLGLMIEYLNDHNISHKVSSNKDGRLVIKAL